MRKNLIDAIAFQTGRVLRKTALIFAGVVGVTGLCWDPQPVNAQTVAEPEVPYYYLTEVVCTSQNLVRTETGYAISFVLDEWDGDNELMVFDGEKYVPTHHEFALSHGNEWEEDFYIWGEDTMTGDVFSAVVLTQGTEDPSDDIIINTGFIGYIPIEEREVD